MLWSTEQPYSLDKSISDMNIHIKKLITLINVLKEAEVLNYMSKIYFFLQLSKKILFI